MTAALATRHAEVVERFVRAWESGDFDDVVALPATWDGEPRPGRYRMVSAPMDGEPAALAYVRAADGRYYPVCLTALSLDADGRIAELTTYVLPELFAAWGFPAVLDP